MIRLNGKNINVSRAKLKELLEENMYDLKRIAVELNGEIVPKIKYEETEVKDGDCIEAVNFVGGG